MGSLRLYDDAACSSQFEQASLASTDEKCIDSLPEGRAIGAKTGVTYVHGTCELRWGAEGVAVRTGSSSRWGGAPTLARP